MTPRVQLGRGSHSVSRREFLAAATAVTFGSLVFGCQTQRSATVAEPIIDIHQHVNYSGRPNDTLLTHQRTMGITYTILLPAGRPVTLPSTHDGTTNGLEAQCLGNDDCLRLARENKPYF